MTAETQKLAIFGASPAFRHSLHVGEPNVPNRSGFQRLVEQALDRNWLTNNGPLVTEFSQRLANYLGVRHCVPTSSGTLALDLLVRQLQLRGEVIVPSFTFIATAHVLRWNGIKPVFCDIDPNTFTLDPESVERLITDKTAGILGVHLWGRACDVEALTKIAERHQLTLFFDAAQAFGCKLGDQLIGGSGRAETFSFHATKVLNTLEGGAIATNDDELAAELRLMTNFGFVDYDKTATLGTNAKMNELSAAMGLASLDKFGDTIAHNQRNYLRYWEGLKGLAGIRLFAHDREKSNFHNITIEVDEGHSGLSRDELCEVLWAEGVLARRYFYPGCHRMEPYVSTEPLPDGRLPVTDRLAGRVLSLPTGWSVTAEDVGVICSLIRAACAQGEAVRAFLDPR